jgi:exonuclease V
LAYTLRVFTVTKPFKREIPVFGVVHDQIIVGVIVCAFAFRMTCLPTNIQDEVKCHIYSNSKADLVSLPSDNTSQAHLGEYFICRSDPAVCPELTHVLAEQKFNMLQLLDTKTRRTDSLPSPEDALPSRLQLMLYYRMLSDLVSESSPFDFSSLWDKLRLDSGQIFSAQFLVDAGLVDCQQERIACLDDLVHLLRRAVEKLDLIGVNQHLQLVYRLQPSRAKKKRNEYRQNSVTPPVISQEERELSLAIEASLKDLEVRENGESSHQNNSPVDVAQPAVNADSSSDNGNATPPSINGNINGKATPSHQDTSNHCADNSKLPVVSAPSSAIQYLFP